MIPTDRYTSTCHHVTNPSESSCPTTRVLIASEEGTVRTALPFNLNRAQTHA